MDEAVSLLPFFALRETGQLLGDGRLWALMFHRDAKAGVRADAHRDQ